MVAVSVRCDYTRQMHPFETCMLLKMTPVFRAGKVGGILTSPIVMDDRLGIVS